jgi:HTH-type transcriptional regulator/antitoxin HipB
MLIRTPSDLGALIRDRRRQLVLGQAELATRIGVSRQWVVGVERGRARAELGLVLRTLDNLGIRLNGIIPEHGGTENRPSDIDNIVAAAQTKRT